MSNLCPHTGLPMTQPDAPMSAEQLAVRVRRLTGSKIAQALSYSDYDPPSRLWRIDMGLEVQEPNEQMWFGNVIEHAIAQLAQRRLAEAFPGEGYEVMFRPDSIFHATQAQWWVTHPDRIFPLAHTGLQIKNHDPSMAARLYPHLPQDHGQDNNVVPMMYRMQVLWEWESVLSWMLDRRLWQHWWLAVYFGGTRLRLYRLVREQKLLDAMIQQGRKFWMNHLWVDGPQTEPSDDIWNARIAKQSAARDAEPAEPRWTDEERAEAKLGVQSLESLVGAA